MLGEHAPSTLIQLADLMIVIRRDLIIVLLALAALLLCRPGDGILVNDRDIGRVAGIMPEETAQRRLHGLALWEN